ncbi:MAG: phosphomevalonate kinase [Myxococcaceae bacterium]|nr:phosphomevalonate kinase [Myxococcaceae bacterium]
MERALTAAGKLFVAGEYAVLWGGVARVLACGPRVGAHARPRDDGRVQLLLDQGARGGPATPGGVGWTEAPGQAFHFAATALDLALRALARPRAGATVALAPSPLGPHGGKLGLGSSARTAVLTAEAIRCALDVQFDALKLALVAHADAQGGRGSGADVAAIFAGGLVGYRRYDVSALLKAARGGDLGSALAVSPPVDVWRAAKPKLPMAWIFTGQSASTPLLIGEVERTLGASGREVFVSRSDGLSIQLEDGLGRGDFALVSEATRGLQALLSELGPVVTEEIERILTLANTFGCVGKVSGAGGGDGCIVFAPDVGARKELLDAVRARGFFALELEPEAGLQGSPTSDPTLLSWITASS